MEKLIEKSIIIIFTLIIVSLISALVGWAFMLLWNFVAPIFWSSAPVLTFYQAWAVTWLLSFIKGFNVRGSK